MIDLNTESNDNDNDSYPYDSLDQPVQQEDTQIQQPITPTPIETESEGFKSAGWGVGSSRIDLSVPENEEQMKQEYKAWNNMKRSPEKQQLEEEWYGKYYNMDRNTFHKE